MFAKIIRNAGNLLSQMTFRSNLTSGPISYQIPVQSARFLGIHPKPIVPIQMTYAQARREIAKPTTILIDVREPSELGKDGRISANAKNIPFGQLESALLLGEEEFQKQYGFQKPKKDQVLITHCKLGIRAAKAAMALAGSGYTKVIVYPGIVDWVENGGELV